MIETVWSVIRVLVWGTWPLLLVIGAFVAFLFLSWLGFLIFRSALNLFTRIFILAVVLFVAFAARGSDRKAEEIAVVVAHAADAITTEIWLAHDPWVGADGLTYYPADRNALYRVLDSPAERIAVRAAGVAVSLWLARKVEKSRPKVATVIRMFHVSLEGGWAAWNVGLIVRH